MAAKINRLHRGDVPVGCNHLTMFVDVQAALCFTSWRHGRTILQAMSSTTAPIPDQKRPYFTLRDARPTLALAPHEPAWKGRSTPGWSRSPHVTSAGNGGGTTVPAMRIERCLIDANWGYSTDVVYQFCRQSAHSAVLFPSHGRFVGASSIPFSEYKRNMGDRVGLNWRIPNVQGKRAVRHVVFDTNYWKSFVHARLAVAMGDRGCLSLFGDKPDLHRLFAEQITAEYRVKTEGRGRTVDEWKLRAAAVDNHWLDCLVGCAVAASIQGRSCRGPTRRPRPRPNRV